MRPAPIRLSLLLLTILSGVLLSGGCAGNTLSSETGSETPAETAPFAADPGKETASALATWKSAGLDLTAGFSISHNSGLCDDLPLAVTIIAPDGYTIAYTTDGTLPQSDDDTGASHVEAVIDTAPDLLAEHRDDFLRSEIVRTSLLEDPHLPAGAVLNVCLVNSDGLLSDPVSRIYFKEAAIKARFPDTLILSVCIDPADLFDYTGGILAAGAVYDEWMATAAASEVLEEGRWWESEANFTQKGRSWERPAAVTVFSPDGTLLRETRAGLRVRGGMSRWMAQKSFNLYFRDDYSAEPFVLDLFGGEERHKSITLRNGGNACNDLKYLDDLLQDLASDRKVTGLRSRPAVLFINGAYYGPFSLNEKLSGQMFANRYGVDADEVIIVENGEIEEGDDADITLYDELMAYAEKDLSDPAVFEAFCRVVDVESMADCFALRIYMGDGDWAPDRNNLIWRTRDASYNEGRWQYILYDTEYSSGLYGVEKTSAGFDHFTKALETFPLFAAAMRNPTF